MQKPALRRVCCPVIDFFPFTAADDQAAVAQWPEMMGYRRAGHVQYGGNIDHAFFAVAQQKEDADSGGVSKLLEDLCNCLEMY